MDAQYFNDQLMKGLFREIYPVIADWVIARSGISSGRCLDLGGGPGMLAVRLAQASDLEVVVVDPMSDCVRLAKENSDQHQCAERVSAVIGRAEELAFADNSIDLVVSRGSIYFWDDQRQGLAEIFRVLRPGGWAFVGGGFGNAELRDKILAAKADDLKWNQDRAARNAKNPPAHFKELLSGLGIDACVEVDDRGTWIVLTKRGDPR